jgi:Fic-DOC domain mobile mystery protein B
MGRGAPCGEFMVMRFMYADGATPIDPDETAGLVPTHITTQAELNAWEEANIVSGEMWAFRRKSAPLDEGFLRALHSKMFDQTWRWAGKFRSSNKNIRVDSHQIAVKLRDLLDNTTYQIDRKIFGADEQAIRFHHLLVWIHPFPNGNGRHARLMADLLITQSGGKRFSWGQSPLTQESDNRVSYLSALRAADAGSYTDIIGFARS